MITTLDILNYRQDSSVDLDAIPLSLLTVGTANPKVGKGEKKGYRTAVLMLAPANLSGFEVCPARTVGCSAACLNTAGRGGMKTDKPSAIHVARIRRTRYFRRDRVGFAAMLEKEINAHIRSAARQGLIPVIRMNGTSDLAFHKIGFTWADGSKSTVYDRYPNVQFYDYTKVISRTVETLPSNYDITFSLADGNRENADLALARGFRVAAVFRNAAKPNAKPSAWNLPDTWNGATLADADESDLRFLDDQGIIVGLRAKGLATSDHTGFVIDIDPA